MYTENDVIGTKKAFRLLIVGMAILVVAMVALVAIGLIQRIAWLNILAALLLAIGLVFLWGNFGARLLAWRRFLRDMRMGLEHELVGEVAFIDEELSHKDGLECYSLRVLTGEDSDRNGGRVLYVEASRFPLDISVGQRARFMLYGNYVKKINPEEPVYG